MAEISKQAVIHKKAKIGQNVTIGPFTIIEEHVEIDEGTSIGPHALITGHTVIGKDNQIFSHAIVGSAPQDLKYSGEVSYLEIGDRNKVRECVTINVGTEGGGGKTKVGDDNLIMAYSHIAHDCQIQNKIIFANAATLAGHVEIGDRAVVSATACIHQFVKIGALSMVAGGSMVNKDVPPYCTVQGDRAILRGMNTLGLKRAGLDSAQLQMLRNAYKLLFVSGLTIEEAIARLGPEEKLSPECNYLTHFVINSKRGVCRPSIESL